MEPAVAVVERSVQESSGATSYDFLGGLLDWHLGGDGRGQEL
jgi:hypothetical protein